MCYMLGYSQAGVQVPQVPIQGYTRLGTLPPVSFTRCSPRVPEGMGPFLREVVGNDLSFFSSTGATL